LEFSFGLKIAAALLLIFIAFSLQKNIVFKKQQIARLSQDKIKAQDLEKELLYLESKLKSLEEQGKTVSLNRKVDFVLKGVFAKGGESVVLIGEEIYHKNDMVSGFMITAITPDGITIIDPATDAITKVPLHLEE